MDYILDTSALLQAPELLARAKTHKFLIPSAVVDDLLKHGRPEPRSMLSSLLDQAIKAGAEVVTTPTNPERWVSPGDRGRYRLDATDMAVVATALALIKDYDTGGMVTVITLDQRLGEFLTQHRIDWLRPESFLKQFGAKEADSSTLRSARLITSAQGRYIYRSATVGAAGALLARAVYDNFSYILATISVWGTLLAILTVGVGLYWYRERYRLAYGITEFMVGFMMSGYVFYPTFDYGQLQLVQGIQLLGGLYVMVRGLDNIGNGVEGTKLERVWKGIFS